MAEVRAAMAEKGYLAGFVAEGTDNEIVLAATEQRTAQEMNDFIQLMAEATSGAAHL